MEANNKIKRAVIVIWFTIVFSAFLLLLDKWNGDIGEGEFYFGLFFYGIFSIMPYKISQGSNAARYFFLILFVISIFLLLGIGQGNMSNRTFIGSLIMIPMDLYAILNLFNYSSNKWFEKNKFRK